jgi:hypothetical protein
MNQNDEGRNEHSLPVAVGTWVSHQFLEKNNEKNNNN